ncbi:DpnII family type II restriction endonuclease [Flavobacterium magnum]|nr:DpnII family type II restriction endonuclease [Flavobacterium magnum]
MIDDEFDNNFLKSIENLTTFINNNCSQFSEHNLLSNFLTQNLEGVVPLTRLRCLISLIGLSEERLKRVVSLIRVKFLNQEFNTEWSTKQISNLIIKDDMFRNLLVDFFINGRNSIVGEEIPLYYLQNFKLLSIDFINDLSNFNYVERILNDGEIQDKYSNRVGTHIETLIKNKIDSYNSVTGRNVSYEVMKEFPLLNKNIDFLIPSLNEPKILIEASYNITTGSGQSKRADQLVDIYSALMKHNANHRQNQIIMVNYCDGFGWVGRQNDLHRIYGASDYVINQKTLDLLDGILDAYI